jgi:hypothetical protein
LDIAHAFWQLGYVTLAKAIVPEGDCCSVVAQEYCSMLSGNCISIEHSIGRLGDLALTVLVVASCYDAPVASNKKRMARASGYTHIMLSFWWSWHFGLARVILAKGYCLTVASQEDRVMIASARVNVSLPLGELWHRLVHLHVAENNYLPITSQANGVMDASSNAGKAHTFR